MAYVPAGAKGQIIIKNWPNKVICQTVHVFKLRFAKELTTQNTLAVIFDIIKLIILKPGWYLAMEIDE